jgi:hypothetical protein
MADRTRYTANLVSDNNLYVDPTTDRVGIGTTNPTSKLYVVGDTYVTGILTANRIFSNVYGEFTGGSISGADIVGTALSISGISTFTNGPVFIGSGTSTGTASQRLQVTGGAYVSGNLGIGLTNPSQSLHVQGNARVTGAVYDSTNSAGTSGQVLQSTVTGTQWVSAAPAGAVTGLVIRDSNNNIVGSSGSITQLTFGSGFGVTGTTGPAGIATVTLSSNLVGTSLSISGISTLGVTSTTNLTAQQLNVSGVVTATSFYGSGANLTGLIANTVATSSTTTPQFIGFLTTNSGISTSILASSTLTYIPSSGNLGIGTTAPTSKLDVVGNVRVSGISTLGITSTTNLTAQQLNVSGISTFQSSNLKVRNPTNTFEYSIVGSAIAANRNLTIPLLTGDDTIATLGLDQTFTGNQTFGGTLSATATISLSGAGAGAHLFGSNQTTGSLTFGGTSGTGNITFGRATTSQTTNIQAGVTASGNQKTINLGTSGASGSFTQINIGPGPSAGVGTVLINTGTRLGIGSAIPRAALDVAGDVRVSGVVTATTFVGALTGTATTATKLETARTFQITGDVVASAISFDGTGNVSLAATIQPNSVGLGTDTTGDYVTNITGTSNQITVTSGTGEGSTPTLSIPSQFTAPQDVTVTRDLQVNRNLNVNGNITIGGTSAALFSQTLSIFDPDIVLGYRTDAFGNDVSNDSTANHGGVALASTEGTPLVDLFIAGIETNPSTYKKIMWFKSGTFSGLGTDAWLINYAVGIGSTQVPNGVRLAAGNVQFTQNDLTVVRNINASGIVTASSFSGNASSATYATTAGVSTNVIGGIGSITQLQVTGVSTFTNGPVLIGSGTSTGTASQRLQVTGGAYISGKLGIGTTNPFPGISDQGIDVNFGSPSIFSRMIGTTSESGIWAADQDYFSLPSYKGIGIRKYGTGTAGNIIPGIPTADTGALAFQNTTNAVIYTNGVTPLVFATFNTERLRIDGANGNIGIGITNPTARLDVGGDARISGVTTFDGAVNFGTSAYFGDNDFVYFGNSSDLYIGHNGSVSAIADTGTGDLYIAGDNSLIITDLSYAENKAKFNTNGSVELYYDNVKEFETTGYGATVFGILQSQGLQINSGVSTLGVTTTTNLTSQNISNSGITTTNSLNIDSIQVISSTRQLQNIASLDATTTATIEAAIANAPNNFNDLNVTGISTLGVTSATNLTAQQLNVSGVSTFQSNNLKIRNPANTFEYSIAGSAIAANRNLTIPLLTGDDTIATLGTNQTFSGIQTFSGTLSAIGSISLTGSATGSLFFGTTQTTAVILIGGTGGTGTISLGRSLVSQQTDIQAGASGIGTSKTINFGTGGLSGSFTRINIGPTAGVGTVLVNTGTNLGIGSAIPRAALDVIGDARVSGVVTATTFIGALTGTATTATNVIGGIGSITQLQVTGISTFTNGPVLIGAATSTGTASQPLQVTGGAYVSGNLGVGVTAPSFTADIAGDARVTSTNKMRFGGTAGTTNFYIQYNSTANSLDFVAG